MEFKTYKKRFNLKTFCIGVACAALILVPITVSTTRAKYQTSESVPLTRGTVNYKVYDFKIMAMYQESDSGEYEEVEVMPTSGYAINEEESYCYTTTSNVHDDTAILKTVDGNHVVDNLKKNSKCYLWFDKREDKTISEIISGYTVSTRSDFSTIYTIGTVNTVFSAEDDDGTSYYYAGAATDNYVYFAGFYWRIIRVNGDGTIRMIYDGTSARENGTSSTDTKIGTSAFNSSHNDNMYVGFRYTSSSVHGLETPSTISEALDTWYTSKLKNYAQYIDTNAGFCGDRTSTTTNGGAPNDTGGTGTTITYYGARYRLETNKTPSLKCPDSSDLYTISTSSKGNKSLSNPIGLISADEVSYAGGVYRTDNTSYYLYTGWYYWTMSPYYFNVSATVLNMSQGGFFYDYIVSNVSGVRPVINLKSDVTLIGNGTSTDPYKIS